MKNTAKVLGLALGIILSWQSVNAKTIVISDIDDTIKISHVLSKKTVFNVPRVHNVFLGMNVAYQELQKQDKSIKFFYITNAPDFIMEDWHQKLVSKNNFPEGPILLRPELSEKEHKDKSIRALLASEKPDFVILIGDNGERDPEIYADIVADMAKKQPQIKFLTQIHMPYFVNAPVVPKKRGKPLRENQEGFATSYEMVLSWFDKGIVGADNVETFLNDFTKNIMVEPKEESAGILAFPDWMDCRGVEFNGAPIAKLPAPIQESALLTLSLVQERCLVPAYNY